MVSLIYPTTELQLNNAYSDTEQTWGQFLQKVSNDLQLHWICLIKLQLQ